MNLSWARVLEVRHHVEKSRRQLGEHMWSTELGAGCKSCVGSGTEARDCMSSLWSD